jgi:glycosyltransferase involved in cell wall biosynthesis
MNVLFLPSWYPDKDNPVRGIFCQKQAEAISKHSRLSVLCIRPSDSLEKNLMEVRSFENETHVIRVFFKKSKFIFLGRVIELIKTCFLGIKYFNELRKEKGNFDIVQVNEINPMGFVAVVLRYIYEVPYVTTLHWAGYTKQDGSYSAMSVFIRSFYKKILDKSLCIVTVSNYLQESVSRITANPQSVVIGNVVDRHAPVPQRRASAGINLLHVSLLNDRKKNVSGIIKIVNSLKNDVINIRLDIVGSGEDEEELKDLSKDSGLLDRLIFFHGLVPHGQISNFYSEADIYICNSNFETFSVACAEALMHGVPVISTRCGGPEDYITSKVCVLVPLNDPEKLLAAITFMIANMDQYDRGYIRKYAESLFAPDKIALDYVKLYEKVVGDHPSHAK